MTSEVVVTPDEVASVAMALTNTTALEKFVAELPSEMVAPYLAKLIDAKINLSALEKGLTQRLVADGQTGQSWRIENREYSLYGSQPKGFTDIPNLITNLQPLGVSIGAIAEAVNGMRVTDLRLEADRIGDPEKRKQAHALIEEHWENKGKRGAPIFKIVTEFNNAISEEK